MRRLSYAVLLLSLLACDQSGISDKGSGTYKESADITQTGDPGYLTNGCDAQGNAVPQVDPRITVGTAFNQVTKVYTDGVGAGDVEIKTEVVALAANKITQKYTVTKANKYYDLAVGDSATMQCELVGANVNCSQIALQAKNSSRAKNFSQAMIAALNAPAKFQAAVNALRSGQPVKIEINKAAATGTDHSKYEDCSFTAQPTETAKLTKGTYKFSNGDSVNAFKLTYKLKGDIQCGTGESFTAADVDLSLLTSNDVPSTDFAFCGGTLITQYMKVTASGKILKGNLSDRTNK